LLLDADFSASITKISPAPRLMGVDETERGTDRETQRVRFMSRLITQ